MGIRPEFITVNTPENSINNLQIKIDIIEPLGKEMLVRGTILHSNILLSFQLPINYNIDVNDVILVQLDEDKILFFDTITGEKVSTI